MADTSIVLTLPASWVQWISNLFRRTPTVMDVGLPRFKSKKGGSIMAYAITLPDDMQVFIPVTFSDSAGAVHAPPSGVSVMSDNTAVATAAMRADNSGYDVVPVSDGTATMTASYTPDGGTPISAPPVAVTVAAPMPTSMDDNPAKAVFTPKGTPTP